MNIYCSNCDKLINNEYVWYDDTTEKYYDYDCFKKLNSKNRLICGKINNKGIFKMIPIVEYGAGFGSSGQITHDLNNISGDPFVSRLVKMITENSFCSHAKEDFYNHIPVFMQNNKFLCLKCYSELKYKSAQIFVLLEDNVTIRELYPKSYEFPYIAFEYKVHKIDSQKFKLNYEIKNLKNLKMDLRLDIIGFSSDIDLECSSFEAFESPVNRAHLIIYDVFDLGDLNEKDSLLGSLIFNIPSQINTFEIAFKNDLLTQNDLEWNNNFDVNLNKKLNVNPLTLYMIVTFSTGYGFCDSCEEKITITL